MGKRSLRPGEYRTAWGVLVSQMEEAMGKLARLRPDVLVLEIDGALFCYLQGATRLSRKGLLEILKQAIRVVPKPKEEIILWAFWETDPPRWEYLAGACRCQLDGPCPPVDRNERRPSIEA